MYSRGMQQKERTQTLNMATSIAADVLWDYDV